MEKTKVSIIIPTYKRNDMLERAINSVLNQTYKNIEVIVVDDNDEGSIYRKNNEILMKKFKSNSKVRYLKHIKNMNGAVARNTGIYNSEGEYITFLDDDDEFLPLKIEKQVEFLEENFKIYDAVYCGFNVYRGGKKISTIKNDESGDLSKELFLMEWGTGSGSNILFKKEAIDAINGFDEKLVRHQDWDVLLRFFRTFKLGAINEAYLNIYKDSRINIPNPDKFLEVKKYCYAKFKSDILKYSESTINEIKQKHLLELSIAYCKNKRYKEAYLYYKKSNESKKVGIKNRLMIILICIYVNLPYKEKILVVFGKFIEKIRLVKA